MWRKIETAPKDGTVILLADYSGYRQRGTDGMWIATGFWREYGRGKKRRGGWTDRVDWLYSPTHWRPLLKPPHIT